jgi:energy-coupling factor transport system ATP-binding protein
VIEVTGVRVEREGNSRPALDGIDLRLAAAERVALLGGNGSGKTTLLRLLNGTELPTRGRVCVAGHDTADPAAHWTVRRTAGLLFQDPDDQFVSTTAAREIAFGLENLRVPTAEIRAAVDAALRRFDLEAQRDTPPHEMSGGEKARLALAAVWAMQPQVLLLDETQSLLDRDGRERLAAALAALPASTLVVHATTDAEIAATYPRIVVLHEGRLVADGEPGAVLPSLPRAVASLTQLPPAAPVATSHAAGARPILVRAHDVEVRWSVFGRAGPLALDGVSLAVQAGDRVGLMGASGAGKSTLFGVWCGLVRPRRGRVEWSPPAAGGVTTLPSLVFQFAERQLFSETVREDVAYGLRPWGVAAAEVPARVDEALAFVGLPPHEFAARVPFHLSGGEMRRVALAGALAQRRSVLLLDEPTLGLDADGVVRLIAILESLHARGVATWIASHDADFIAATCDRVVVLARGRIAYDGSPGALWADDRQAAILGIDIPTAHKCSPAGGAQRLGSAPQA